MKTEIEWNRIESNERLCSFVPLKMVVYCILLKFIPLNIGVCHYQSITWKQSKQEVSFVCGNFVHKIKSFG